MWFNHAGCLPKVSWQINYCVTYLTREFNILFKASNTCFIYAIQANIIVHTNICQFYIFMKKFSIKNAWKSNIWIRLHTIREVLFYSRFVWAVFYVVPQLGLGNHMYCIQWTTSKFCTRVVLQHKWEQDI